MRAAGSNKISVIIPFHGDPDETIRLIEQLSLPFNNFQIIVSDDFPLSLSLKLMVLKLSGEQLMEGLVLMLTQVWRQQPVTGF